jgi:anti-anti-sigma factor
VLEIKSKLLWKGLYVMERPPTTSTVSIVKRNKRVTNAVSAKRINTAPGQSIRRAPSDGSSSPSSGAARVWAHTLVLTGALTHRSAHALEVEIERLCDEGVTAVTLDLRQLQRIDSIGVAVVAFRCGLCQRRGLGFNLIPGSQSIQRAFEQAGVGELLPFQVDDLAARRLRAPTPRPALSQQI